MSKLIHKASKSHYEKYRDMAKSAGVSFKRDKKPMGYTRDELIELYKKDQHLNNIPLRKFDAMTNMLNAYHVVKRTLAEGVCLYKHLLIYEVIGAQWRNEV